MITRIIISREEYVECLAFNATALSNLLERRLIEQDRIDANYYKIKYKRWEHQQDMMTDKCVYIIEYELVRREEWSDIDETENRLRMGL